MVESEAEFQEILPVIHPIVTVKGLTSCQTGSQLSLPVSQALVHGGSGAADIDHGRDPFDFVVSRSVQEVGDARYQLLFLSLSVSTSALFRQILLTWAFNLRVEAE